MQTSLLLLFFGFAAVQIRPILRSRCGDESDVILRIARQEFILLIPQMPHLGGRRNLHSQLILAAAFFLAFYRTLSPRGWPVEEIGKLAYETVKRAYGSYLGGLLRLLAHLPGWFFNDRGARRMALLSQKRQYPGDFICVFVEGDGSTFDYGFDYLECGILKFFLAQNAVEFTRYMCRLDYPVAETIGVKLFRTSTLAEGAEKCDFRYKR